MGNGEFVYLGIKKNLCQKNCDFFNHEANTINVTFNTDGFPACKSSKSSAWPILGYCGRRVFLIALYCGRGEPEDFNELVAEVKCLYRRGITICGKKYIFSLRAFVADTQAKASVLNIKAPGAYYCCPKCTIKGARFLYKGRGIQKRKVFKYSNIFFNEFNQPKQSSWDYKNFTLVKNPTHPHNLHNGRTVLADLLPMFNIVDSSVVDDMHARDTGCGKKYIKALTEGFTGFRGVVRRKPVIVSKHQKLLNLDLEKLHKFCPTEFARKPRSLTFRAHFKSAEYRQFIHYTGIVLLKKYLPHQYYKNFSLLVVAMRILSMNDQINEEICNYTKILIEKFLRGCSKLFGAAFLTHSLHILTHLPDDVLKFGHSASISCYRFEDFNFHLTNQIRTGSRIVRQILNRYNENCYHGLYERSNEEKSAEIFIKSVKKNGICSIRVMNFTFRCDREGDRYCEITGNRIVKIQSFQIRDGEIYIRAREFRNIRDLFK